MLFAHVAAAADAAATTLVVTMDLKIRHVGLLYMKVVVAMHHATSQRLNSGDDKGVARVCW
jgi:hypothetical protein